MPASCLDALRELQGAARQIVRGRLPQDDNDDDDEELPRTLLARRSAQRAFLGLQKAYTSRVEACVRALPTAEEAAPLVVTALAEIKAQNDQIIGLFRYLVSLFPCSFLFLCFLGKPANIYIL